MATPPQGPPSSARDHSSGDSAFDDVPIPAAVLDAEGRIERVNRAWRDEPAGVCGRVGTSLVDAIGSISTGADGPERLRRLLGEPSGRVEIDIDRPGARRACLVGVGRAGGGAAVSILGAIERVAGSELHLARIVDSAMDAIITTDDAHRIVMFNKSAERIFGVSSEDALGTNVNRFVPERYRAPHGHYMEAFGRGGSTMRRMGRLGTLSGVRADGTEFPIEASISLAETGGRKLYTVILRDISERTRLEAQLLHSQKLEGIGRLAGGIAHDFNNLLMAVFNYLKLATHRLDESHPARSPLESAKEAADRAAALTRQLLAFARKQVVKPKVLCPNHIIAGMEGILRPLVGKDHSLEIDLAPEAWNVLIDGAQLEQVVMNLSINGRDAMPGAGTLTIETRNVTLDDADAFRQGSETIGDHVLIRVSDSGVGMSPEVRAHLFEPFFTTKPPGEGTGLGLATCHGIVTQAGGHIVVASEQGAGSSMSVFLPRAHSDDPAERPARRGDRGPAGETILVVDESRMSREVVAAALRAAGYAVLEAQDGEDALKIASGNRDRIHALIADASLCGMSAIDLAAELRRARGPIALCLLVRESAPVEATALGATCVSKPFDAQALVRTLRHMLESEGRR